MDRTPHVCSVLTWACSCCYRGTAQHGELCTMGQGAYCVTHEFGDALLPCNAPQRERGAGHQQRLCVWRSTRARQRMAPRFEAHHLRTTVSSCVYLTEQPLFARIKVVTSIDCGQRVQVIASGANSQARIAHAHLCTRACVQAAYHAICPHAVQQPTAARARCIRQRCHAPANDSENSALLHRHPSLSCIAFQGPLLWAGIPEALQIYTELQITPAPHSLRRGAHPSLQFCAFHAWRPVAAEIALTLPDAVPTATRRPAALRLDAVPFCFACTVHEFSCQAERLIGF